MPDAGEFKTERRQRIEWRIVEFKIFVMSLVSYFPPGHNGADVKKEWYIQCCCFVDAYDHATTTRLRIWIESQIFGQGGVTDNVLAVLHCAELNWWPAGVQRLFFSIWRLSSWLYSCTVTVLLIAISCLNTAANMTASKLSVQLVPGQAEDEMKANRRISTGDQTKS